MRKELPQEESEPDAVGTIAVYHTNDWLGSRKTGQHWNGDLPDTVAHKGLKLLKKRLINEGWVFSPDKTKILMLTHTILSKEQGYEDLIRIFSYSDAVINKRDPHIKFFAETLEPSCIAYTNKKYGEMFNVIGSRAPKITKHADKISWTKDFDKLIELRSKASVGEVLDHVRTTERPRLSEAVERRELELIKFNKAPSEEEPSYIGQLRELRNISYQNIIRVTEFIENNTPFSTKHGVKGEEFENVLVVLGRWEINWTLYESAVFFTLFFHNLNLEDRYSNKGVQRR